MDLSVERETGSGEGLLILAFVYLPCPKRAEWLKMLDITF
jgi:hypothetical protein